MCKVFASTLAGGRGELAQSAHTKNRQTCHRLLQAFLLGQPTKTPDLVFLPLLRLNHMFFLLILFRVFRLRKGEQLSTQIENKSNNIRSKTLTNKKDQFSAD